MTKGTQSQVGLWKHKRPKVEEWVKYCLDGEKREQILDFVEWAREMGFKHKIHSTNNSGHNVFYNNEYMCRMMIHAKESPTLLYWEITPCLIHLDLYTETINNEDLGNIPWKPNYCIHKKQPNKTLINNTCNACSIKGVDRLAFGEDFVQCCVSFPAVENPDNAELERIKRLLILEKEARDNIRA